MVDFGGWEMPLWYLSTGVLKEHRTCRTGAVVTSAISAPWACGPRLARLQYALTNDLDRIGPRAQYSHLLDEADGSVVDDVIVWWVSGDDFQVMPNASDTEGGRRGRRRGPHRHPGHGAVRRPALADRRIVRGRRRRPLPGEALLVAGRHLPRRRHRLHGRRTGWSVRCRPTSPSRSGRRCSTPASCPRSAPATPLRLEAGLPLHGHGLGPGITPLQANLGWVVSWDKGDLGKAALEVEQAASTAGWRDWR